MLVAHPDLDLAQEAAVEECKELMAENEELVQLNEQLREQNEDLVVGEY